MTDVVVVGAGIVGLTTALVLRERGLDVALWARDDPADTVSAVAGAIWYPFLAEPRARVLAWSAVTFRRLVQLAHEPGTGVHLQPVVEVFAHEPGVPWWAPAAGPIEPVPRGDVPPPHAAALRTVVPVCTPALHLPWLVRRLRALGVPLQRRTVGALDDVFATAPAVVNCTGLGARTLCGDTSLAPVRGQVLVVPRPTGRAATGDVDVAWIDDTTAQPLYAIPRAGDIVLGGTSQRGDERTAADPADTRTILDALAARLPALAAAVAPVTAITAGTAKAGLRPWRPEVRLEPEPRGHGRRVVHCYGHGGSGYTLAWGCAAEVAALLGR